MHKKRQSLRRWNPIRVILGILGRHPYLGFVFPGTLFLFSTSMEGDILRPFKAVLRIPMENKTFSSMNKIVSGFCVNMGN